MPHVLHAARREYQKMGKVVMDGTFRPHGRDRVIVCLPSRGIAPTYTAISILRRYRYFSLPGSGKPGIEKV